MKVDPTDYLQLLIYYFGTFEPHCLPYLRSCAGLGATFLDVGANVGFYTLEGALSVGPTGRVIAIEAAPPNAEWLAESVRLNDMLMVTLIESAVGSGADSATLALPKSGNKGMFTLGAVDGDQKYEVEVRTIDSLLQERGIQHIDFIKMDIEGSELHALRGAEGTIRRSRPAILIELNDEALLACGSTAGEVKALLGDLGYSGWIIGKKSVLPVSAGFEHKCDECLFVHSDDHSLIRRLNLP